VGLAVKRMIRYAAQSGFDKVAFVNGQQSADRYDLSKYVASVTVARTPDGFTKGKLGVSAYDHAATRVVERFVNTFDEVADVIGKELASKAQEELKHKDQATFAANDLKIGGEGMKAFYDTIVPNVVNDVLKKLGGGKIGTVEIGGKAGKSKYFIDTQDIDLAPDGKQEVFVRDRKTMDAVAPPFNSVYEARVWLLEHNKFDAADVQPGFAITDALREKAQNGLPLFARSAMKDSDANIRRGTAAMNAALLNQTTVHRAMFRNGLGWVDFEWGDVGTVKASGKTKGAMGLAHILEARQRKDGMTEQEAVRLLGDVVTTIATGTETARRHFGDSVNVTLQLGNVEAVLVKHAGSNAWVLTGWQVNPGATGAGYVAPGTTHSAATTAHGQVGAGFNSSIDDSGEDGGPLFSRSPQQLSAQVGALVKGLTVTNIKNKDVDWRGIGLQMLGRRQLTELYGKLFPQANKPNRMAAYNTLAMKMDAEKNEAGAAADKLTTRWGRLPKQVGDALAELIHEATRRFGSLQPPHHRLQVGHHAGDLAPHRVRLVGVLGDAGLPFRGDRSQAWQPRLPAVDGLRLLCASGGGPAPSMPNTMSMFIHGIFSRMQQRLANSVPRTLYTAEARRSESPAFYCNSSWDQHGRIQHTDAGRQFAGRAPTAFLPSDRPARYSPSR
jgi:Large polyvalent protein associated domain 39/phage-Barnase-EndoU-ColicinE5/D-RelE like nuclease1